MADRDRPLYAVLIDGDNVSAKYADAIMKEVTGFAEPALRKVYGDWTSSGLKPWKEVLSDNGLVGHQETANKPGKNASDIGMVIDAMDILHTGRLDGFVIVSSDSDFTRLASRIREHGKTVIGMGERKSHKSFVNACHRFIYLELLITPKTSDSKEKPKQKKEKQKEELTIILRAMEKMDPDAEGYHLGGLGKFIYGDKPDFDTRNYGEKKLSDLVDRLPELELSKVDGQMFAKRIK